jgi:hypothetical protein
MTESSNEILFGHLKSIRAKFGDKVADDPKALSALLALEAPQLRGKIDAFVASLSSDPAPTIAPATTKSSPETKPAVTSGPTPSVNPSVVSAKAGHRRRNLVIGAVAFVFIIGIVVVYIHETSSYTPASIIVTSTDGPPAPTRAPTSHAGAQLVEKFDSGPLEKMFNGHLLVGQNGSWEGGVDQNGYRLTNADGTGKIKWLTPNLVDTNTQEPIPVDSIEADVNVNSADLEAGAGLVFSGSETSAYWFMINKDANALLLSVAIGPNGKVSFGSTQTIQVSRKSNGWYHLTVRRSANGPEFLVDGKTIATQSDSSIQGLNAGLVAHGVGAFHYRNVVRILG